MARPIFLIQFPHHSVSRSKIREAEEAISKKLNDWHVLIATTSVGDICCTAFSDQTATEVEIENLKEMLLNQFK